jgi:sugar phosphate permease
MGKFRQAPNQSATSASGTGQARASRLASENAVVWTLWLTYGAFYFCRTNISAAVPGLKASGGAGGLGLSGEEIGWILASLKIAYGLGQLVNGQLSERISPRVMLAAGMFGSAALNLLFGFSTGFYFLLFVWAMNGFCQSLGWTPCVRVAANWVPIERRGHAIGIIGTGYQITLGLTYVVAGQAAQWLGWRGALYVPAVLLALAGVFMLAFLREAPAPSRVDAQEHSRPATRPATRLSFSEVLFWTLYNPTLWLIGLSLGLLNACRYGFLDWGVTHLMETRDVAVGEAGLQFFVIAIGAAAGSYLSGWASDRFFGGRRGPIICVLMALLGVLTLAYDAAVHSTIGGSMLLLVVIGFCIYGPQVLLVGTAPADLAHRGTSAAAAGFVNFMGYVGAASGDVITGYFSAAEHGGWQLAIYIWAAWAFAGSAMMAILWNTTTQKVGLLPGVVPKLATIAMLAVAGAAAWGRQPAALQIATWAAIAASIATFFNRWAAVPGFIVAAAGVVAVFMSYLETNNGIAWDQSVAMAAYGIAMLAAVMIIVERKGAACELS